MTRNIAARDLIGTAEAAKKLKCSPWNIYKHLKKDPHFPKPVMRTGTIRLWYAGDITAYKRANPGRVWGRK